ncbi:Tyrosine decarboxylase [Portunus trituberculatus]|uniref:Tyrosine decarboxylase n=1 Tax=Portunus trituberculatus TaxID=210409 RepID=A0A5B7G4N1_PORTR|nr:Tyrosine decarboxylase [Portunus trituberculatus]
MDHPGSYEPYHYAYRLPLDLFQSLSLQLKKPVEAEDEVVKAEKVRKQDASLQYKRSFFVRMVSDPKIYNPKIVRSLPCK